MPNDSNAAVDNGTAAPAADPTSAAPAATQAPAPATAPAAAAAPDATTAAPAATDPAAPAGSEGKPAEAKADDGKPVGAPEQYEAFAAPEGVTLDDAVLTDFQGVAKEMGLSQEAAQALIDKMAPTIAKQNQAQLDNLTKQVRAEWVDSSKADKEFGGDKLDENLAVAKRAWETYGTPELTQLLNDSGLGDHPEVIRWAYRVGKTISPDSRHVSGGNPDSAGKDARSFYPNSNHAA